MNYQKLIIKTHMNDQNLVFLLSLQSSFLFLQLQVQPLHISAYNDLSEHSCVLCSYNQTWLDV